MPTAALVSLTALFLKDNDLIVFFGFDQNRRHLCPIDERVSEAGSASIADHEHIGDLDFVSGLCVRKLVDLEGVILLNGELPALSFDRRFHEKERIRT